MIIQPSPLRWTRRLAVALIILATPLCLARTWYVDNAYEHNGDGTRPEAATSPGEAGAWNSLDAAARGDIQPGDVLEIRKGMGFYREGAWKPRFSGTADRRITIQNFPGDDAIIDGTTDISGSTWLEDAEYPGVFIAVAGVTGTVKKFPFTAWYDTGSGEQRLNLIQSDRDNPDVPPGAMRYNSKGQVVAHLADNSNPADAIYFRIPTLYTGIALVNYGVDYLTFRKNPRGGSFKIQRMRDHGISSKTSSLGITYDGLEICWLMDRGINQSEGGWADAGYVIRNCHVHHCGQEGIRWSQDTSPDGLVEDNHVHHIQSEPVFERTGWDRLPGFTDNGTGIRVIAANGTVRRNIIHDMGGGSHGKCYAIDLENGCPHITVEENRIYNLNHGLIGSRSGHGIAITASGGESYDGLVIQNNRIHNTDTGLFLDFGKSLPKGDRVSIRNNTFSDPSWCGLYKEDGVVEGSVRVANNVFSAVATSPQYLILASGPESSGFETPTRNLFYAPRAADPDRLIDFKDGCYGAANIAELDSSSVYENPQLDTRGVPPLLTPLPGSRLADDIGARATAEDGFRGSTRNE